VLSDRQLQALTVALHCQEAISATPAGTAAPASPGQQVALVNPSDDGEGDADRDDDCKHGARGRGAAQLKVRKDGEARIRNAAVLSSDAGSLTVDTPGGPVVVRIDDDAEVNGDLAAAAEVEVEGELNDANAIQASQVEVLCAVGADEDEGDDRRGNGRGHGAKDKADKEQGNRNEDDGGGEDD
jgi:hypothetical protein